MYEFYLGDMLFPVTPKTVTIKPKNQNARLVLINEGEINLIKMVGLTEISFQAHLPNRAETFAFYTSGFKNAAYFLDELKAIKNSKEPKPFIISRFTQSGGLLFDTSLMVTLEDFPMVEDAEIMDGDVMVEISLCQWRSFGTKIAGVVYPKDGGEPTLDIQRQRPVSGREIPREMSSGNTDTLWSLAKRALLDGERFTDIYTLNQAAIDSLNEATGFGIYNVQPGMMLRMPLSRSPQDLAVAFMPDRILS